MRAFACSHCGQLLFFENSHCLRCGTALGFAPEVLELSAIEPVAWDRYRAVDAAPTDEASRKDAIGGGPADRERTRDQRYKRCARAGMASCNWLVAADSAEELCMSCRLTKTLPLLRTDAEMRAFAQAEGAKRRLLYQLLDLGLPLVARQEDEKLGLSFVLAFRADDKPVITGHCKGVITVDLLECDNVHRERLRHQFGEPYRTLLGHFRHEIGHYYWDLLIDDKPALARFRELFGDERVDYRAALRRNYEIGGGSWSSRFVSSYAASHPWEDWAETFAHYLHIRDTLQTAANFGLRVSPAAQTIPPAGGKLTARATEAVTELEFAHVVAEWLPLTYAFNAANRSMGKEDLYPFVLADEVIEKLSFVHDLVRFVELSEALPPGTEASSGVLDLDTSADGDADARESRVHSVDRERAVDRGVDTADAA
ncbi:MAG: hypothetical protein RLZZ450_5129 [Pseudomonadota bacterium]|jgi:hypothetical protein